MTSDVGKYKYVTYLIISLFLMYLFKMRHGDNKFMCLVKQLPKPKIGGEI